VVSLSAHRESVVVGDAGDALSRGIWTQRRLKGRRPIAIQPPPDQSIAKASAMPVICLVDDDPLVLKSLGNLLASDGIASCCFDKPESFLAHVETHPAAVVVLDIWMESMTGIELLARLLAESPRTRVILITGYEDPATVFSLTQAGASALLVKPFKDEELLSLVRRELGSTTRSGARRKRFFSEIRHLVRRTYRSKVSWLVYRLQSKVTGASNNLRLGFDKDLRAGQ